MSGKTTREIPLPLVYKVRETLDVMLHQAGPEARIPASTVHSRANHGLDDGLPLQDVLNWFEAYDIVGFVKVDTINGEPTIVSVSDYYLKQNSLFLGERINSRIEADKRRRRLSDERTEIGRAFKKFGLDPRASESKLKKQAEKLEIEIAGSLGDGVSACFSSVVVDLKSPERNKYGGYGASLSESLCNAMTRVLVARKSKQLKR